MSGRPKAGQPGPRPRLWKLIRAGRDWSAVDAARMVGCDRSSAVAFFRSLIAGGIVDVLEARTVTVQHRPDAYSGEAVPRLQPDGVASDIGQIRAAAWKAMRILQSFDLPTLAATTGGTDGDLRKYCEFLDRAGYLKRVGGPRSKPAYRFLPQRYTGPLAPQVVNLRSAVWDPNKGVVVWPVDTGEGGDV